MRKLKLLFAAAALLGGVCSANAQGWIASVPANGNFYLYNVGANAYLENGANWTTHAALKSSGFVVNLTANNGVYTIGTNSKYDGKFFTDNGYVDTGGSTNWIFEPVAGLTNTYKLKAANGNYVYAAAGMYQVEVGSDPGTNKAYWKLVTATNRDAETGASATNPIEWTHKINNPRFDDNNSGWQDAPVRGGKVAETWQGDASLFNDFNPCAEHFNKTYDTYQELTNLPNGTYAISVQGFYREGGFADAASKHVAGTESLNAKLYANGGGEDATQPLMSIFEGAGKASGGGTATASGIDGIFPNDMDAASYFFSAGLYWNVVYVQVTSGTLKFGVKKTTAVGDDWTIFDNFRLQYFGDCTINEAKFGVVSVALNEAVAAAQGFINSKPALSTEQIAALQIIVNDNDNDDNAFTQESQFTTAAETINNALAAYQAMVAPYAIFNALKLKADAIAAVEYTETTSGSHTTFTNAITAQTNAANSASSADDITTATTNLVAAIKTFIAGAEPKNDGEYFDITCLMTNPNFDDSHNGWTYLSAPGVNWSNCEYYEKEFDINQTVTGLPTGSYSLSVQAFQRPGWAGNVYNDYISGTDNASSVLYINSITSNVKNIAADAQATYKLGDGSSFEWPNDSRVGTEGSYKYVPNSQQGANLWFAAGLYDATCAAVVDDAANGSLKLGFKSTKTHVSGDWTIFDNFRLYYYGSSLLVYYKQYLPQLKKEVSADLANGTYANVLTSSEDEALDEALAATPASETEAAYKAVIDNLVAAQAAFRAAATAYDAIVAAKASSLTKISSNIGTGVFQYNSSTNDEKYSAYETAKSPVNDYEFTTSSTAAGAQDLVDALNTAISNYNNQALNAPANDKRYNVSIVEDGKDWDGNAITFIAGARTDAGLYGIKYLASANANLNQALKFTAVDGYANTYKVSAINAETGEEQYITTGSTYGGGNNQQIRTTDDANKASWVKIAATTTDGQFQLLNVSDGNKVIANNNNNDMYTAGNANFTIAEASQASVSINIADDVKFATRIFPFAPSLPTGVTAYTLDGVSGGKLTLTEVATPAANVPYVLYAENGYTGDALIDWGTAAAETYTEGLLTGVYVETTPTAGDYVMQNSANGVGFFKVPDTGFTKKIAANRCYMTYSAPETEAREAFYFDFNDTTGIDAIEALTTGKAQIFNAAGAQVPGLQKGINIIKLENGSTRKIMVK